ncbi:hypothetical protein [Alishewanella tabrizica]|uniref:Uncharacterized protein n=1 Tax=Alishewanella tabrizica TaxID=671278 RepID=A0ABQ2WTE6_9ALTE|nr:hypothetical protein [Alishewanella tabrizica]GGW73948.1 hypothetical protein GCM10008111_32230 [Alishewanella tabrizica]
MNIPIMQPDDREIFDLTDFCHFNEMENFSNHLYLEHKGARTGVIGGDDPCEAPINGISPKVFSLLMMANEDLYFSPVTPHPDVGIMLELPLPFGQLTAYSMTPGCWTSPSGGTRFLGFLMTYNQHHKALAPLIQDEFKNVIVMPEIEGEQLVLASFLALDIEYYLNDICQIVCNLLKTCIEIDSRLSKRN